MPTNSSTPPVRYLLLWGFSGYSIGDDGSIWSQLYPSGKGRWRRGEWKRLKPYPHRNGSLLIQLGARKYYVHRLVLEAFVGPCPDGMECRHLDGNPSNNRLDNLAWGTHSENERDKVRHGTSGTVCQLGIANASAKLTDEKVREMRRRHAEGATASSIARELGVSHETARKVVTGMRWKHVS
jgi:hypothetical protein